MALSIEEFKYQLTRQLKPGPQEQEGISIVIVEHQFIIKSKIYNCKFYMPVIDQCLRIGHQSQHPSCSTKSEDFESKLPTFLMKHWFINRVQEL